MYIFKNFRNCPILCTFLNLIFGQKPIKKKNNSRKYVIYGSCASNALERRCQYKCFAFVYPYASVKNMGSAAAVLFFVGGALVLKLDRRQGSSSPWGACTGTKGSGERASRNLMCGTKGRMQ